MADCAAFLRAINVGGRVVKGPALVGAFRAAGLEETTTFRASGNVVFTAGRRPSAALKRLIEDALADALGYDVVVFLRSASELRAIAASEPFPRDAVAASEGKLQVFILEKMPAKRAQGAVLGLATDADRLAFGKRELYWLPSGRTRDSELDLKTLAKLIGPATQRTMGTIELMAAKYFG